MSNLINIASGLIADIVSYRLNFKHASQRPTYEAH